MRKAFILTTTAVAVAYLTLLIIQGMSEEVSILRELAAQRITVTRLSSCSDAITEDLPRYLRGEVEKEVLRSASMGILPNSMNVEVEEWKTASCDFLEGQGVLAELDMGCIGFGRTDRAPEGALVCGTSFGYVLRDEIYETELRDRRAISFIVPIRIYLMSDVVSGFRSSIIGKIWRAFMGNINSEGDTIRRIVTETIRAYQRSCAARGLDFGAKVGFEFDRGNVTTTVFINFEELWVTDISPEAIMLVNGEPTRVTFRKERSTIELLFRHH